MKQSNFIYGLPYKLFTLDDRGLRNHFHSSNTKNYLYEDTLVKAVLDKFSSEFNFVLSLEGYPV